MRLRSLFALFLLAACADEPAVVTSTVTVDSPPVWRELGRPLREAFGIAGPSPYYPGQDAKRAWQLREAQAIGLSHYRHELKWNEIETAPGVFVWNQDTAIEEAHAHDQRMLAVIAYGNHLYSAESQANGNDGYYPPDDPNDMAPFAQAAVERYKDKIRRWEFWNEPNGGYRFWKSAIGGEPERFAELAVVAAKAMRKADPDIQIALGGLFYHDYVVVPGAPKFLDAVLRARPELKSFYDAVSYHPYKPYPPTNPPEENGSWDEDQDRTVDAMRAVMDAHGWAAKELWITENGWPLSPAVGEVEQAQYLVRSALLAFARGVTEFDWYTFWDHEDPSKALVLPEAYFGLVRPGTKGMPYDYDDAGDDPPVKKLGFQAMAVMLRELGDATTVADVSGAHRASGARLIALRGPKQQVIAVWHSAVGGRDSIPVPLWEKRAPTKAMGMLGEPLGVPQPGATLALTPSPVYLFYGP